MAGSHHFRPPAILWWKGNAMSASDLPRDPTQLIIGIKALLESPQRFFTEHHDDWQTRIQDHRAERIALHQTFQAIEELVARVRVVLVVLPPHDAESDWEGVEQAAGRIDRERARRANILGGVQP